MTNYFGKDGEWAKDKIHGRRVEEPFHEKIRVCLRLLG